MSTISIPIEQARAALWVIGNSKFTGRKHPSVKSFATTLKQAGVDLCCGSGTCPDCPES